MSIQEYISEIQKQFSTGVAREHTYRPALQNLLATLLPHLVVSNEPARQACGAPDYILQRKDTNMPVAFVEAKDLDESDLAGRKNNREQFERYKKSLDNIIFTDYLDFWLYEKGEFVDSVRIAERKGDRIVAVESNMDKFGQLIAHFGNARPQKITSSTKLAEIMAAKARLLADVMEKTLSLGGGSLEGEMAAFKDVLIHDITPKEFADVYAQTIVYGMFAARLHDTSPETFSRQEAATLIPKTNPFLRQLFQNIAGYDLDERISWIVDDLSECFRATDIRAVMKGFGKRTQQTDPMIHFYENFLSAYDPKLRKSRGVWYTPQAVVNFIVRAVDDILRTEFGLPMGLADTSKITVERSIIQSRDKRYADNKKKQKVEVHKVQILDPAAGTGTFLAEAVRQIHEKFKGQAGMWQGYVEDHLLPRLNGFELLMASYTIAHLKLDMLLTETGYRAANNERLRVFLTNSLEEFHKDTGTLFAQFLAREANGANDIKRDTPVMVVLGNPPYSGVSSNNGAWISRLIDDYKYVNGKHFKERKHWLNDDYVKFIRLGQTFVEKNHEGVLAYINSHKYLSNPTFRGMRWNLMKSFDKIYVIDLHGSSKPKEICPDGSPDQNIFDIQQGVSINIFIKTGKKNATDLAEVLHYDLWGKRQKKYNYLLSSNISSISFEKIEPTGPFYLFQPNDEAGQEKWDNGFKVDALMSVNVTGVQTSRDSLVIDESANVLLTRIKDFVSAEYTDDQVREKYFGKKSSGKYLPGDSRSWSLLKARKEIKDFDHKEYIKDIDYRPLDKRSIYYHNSMIDWSRDKVMKHMLRENTSVIVGRQGQAVGSMLWNLVYVSNTISDLNLFYRGGAVAFPLYLYPEQDDFLHTTRTPNLDLKIVEKIAQAIGLTFEPEKSGDTDKFAPIDLLDYIYAVLHSPTYREKYKEFLKVDFPRVPYPDDAARFRELCALGGELRRIHLMEHPVLSELITCYPVAGSHAVEKPRWELLSTTNDNSPDAVNVPIAPAVGRVWINGGQYFDQVPLIAWEFYIGGYQPAQKWLKDRQGKTLSFDDIMHYQRIIKALSMTDGLMKEIDAIEI